MAFNSNSWEQPGQHSRSCPSTSGLNNSNFIRTQPNVGGPMLNTPLGRVQVAPPPPPRPVYNNYNSIFAPQGSYMYNYVPGGYHSYGGSGYGYGFRPGLNSYGYGYGPGSYYGPNNPESRFIQLAEESSRPAFQSIQSILQAFNSVAMMFDSTFNALYSSYMSVIGVADNFGKLRSTFGQIFSALAVFQTIHWFFKRILYLIGISENNPDTESFWAEALTSTGANQNPSNRKPWLMMLLLSIFMAGPYFLFKLMSYLYPSPTSEIWDPAVNPGSLAVAMYDFHPSNDQELGFYANQKLMIAPQKFQSVSCPDWLVACNENKKIGLIPNNYIGKIMHASNSGKTYIEHNGQQYETAKSNEANSMGFKNNAEGINGNPTEINYKNGDGVEDTTENK